MILACDVRGTKTNVALLASGATGLEVTRLEPYSSHQHATLTLATWP